MRRLELDGERRKKNRRIETYLGNISTHANPYHFSTFSNGSGSDRGVSVADMSYSVN